MNFIITILTISESVLMISILISILSGAIISIKKRIKIIHCKDCWKDGTIYCAMYCGGDCVTLHSWNEGDDFCSWGERERK